MGTIMTWISMVLFTFSMLLLAPQQGVTASSATSDGKGFSLAGIGPDPFVAAAPLIAAAVCSDGVVLVALHTIFANEPLLLGENDGDNNTTSANDATNSNETATLQDLSREYRGPFRIHSIDDFGTGLVCTGWRADTRLLADYCRSAAAEELAIYGKPPHGEQYGSMLASDASGWMAQCVVSESIRALSTVGLLASCGGPTSGYLWLIDATGAYRVRAHAVGSMAGVVNEQLRRVDWSLYNKEEAAKKLVEMLKELEGLPSEARVELACISANVPSGQRQLKRLFVSRLFGVAASK